MAHEEVNVAVLLMVSDGVPETSDGGVAEGVHTDAGAEHTNGPPVFHEPTGDARATLLVLALWL
jgi:hypothetical protein